MLLESIIPTLANLVKPAWTNKHFTTGHFLPNAPVPDAATCCGDLVAQTNSVNVGQKRQQVGASVKVSGSETNTQSPLIRKF
jgi:hypothetical protein